MRFSDSDSIGTCVVGVAHEHVDHRQIGADRGLHAAVAGLDDQIAVDLAHDGRLDDADRCDRRQQLLVHRRRRRRLRGLFGLGLSVRGSTLRSSAMVGSCLVASAFPVLGETLPARRIPVRRGKGEAAKPGARGQSRGRPLRRAAAMRHVSVGVLRDWDRAPAIQAAWQRRRDLHMRRRLRMFDPSRGGSI